MAHELGHLGIDIAALSETRLSDEGQLEEIGAGYTFFWKGLPAGERRDYGIGIAIRTNLMRQLVELPVGISERLMTLRLYICTYNSSATQPSSVPMHQRWWPTRLTRQLSTPF